MMYEIMAVKEDGLSNDDVAAVPELLFPEESWMKMAAMKRCYRETGFPLDSGRTGKAGFGHSQAGNATVSAQKRHTEWLRSISAETSELKTLANYYQAKYNNSPAYQLLMGYSRAVEKGDISPLVGYDVYRNTANNIQQTMVGAVTLNGITIGSYATHFID